MADVASALKDADTKMSKAVEVAKDDFASIRTGRAHPSMFNKIMVDYYGTYTALLLNAEVRLGTISKMLLHMGYALYSYRASYLFFPSSLNDEHHA